jgi:hypothetical protein
MHLGFNPKRPNPRQKKRKRNLIKSTTHPCTWASILKDPIQKKKKKDQKKRKENLKKALSYISYLSKKNH